MVKEPEVILGEEPNQTYISRLEKEIINGYRDFSIAIGSDAMKFRVFEPNSEQQELISAAYSDKYNQLLIDGKSLVWEEILKNLRNRGIWNESDDNMVEDTTEEIKEIVKLYLKAIENKDYDKNYVEKLKKEYFNLKKKIDKHLEKKNTYYVNSIESKANEHATKCKLMLCLFYEKDSEYIQYFNSIEELNKFRNRVIVSKLLRECLTFWAGIPQEYLSAAPKDDFIFGGNGLHTLLENSSGEQSTPSMKMEEQS